jgi:hypothetical protein
VERERSRFIEGLNTTRKDLERGCSGIFNLDDFMRRIRVDVELPSVFGMIRLYHKIVYRPQQMA